MDPNITHLAAQEHINDLRREAHQHDQLREAQQHRHHGAVRRVAVIRPAGSHFKLMPIQPALDARRRLDATGG
jgi:hypothetical protein